VQQRLPFQGGGILDLRGGNGQSTSAYDLAGAAPPSSRSSPASTAKASTAARPRSTCPSRTPEQSEDEHRRGPSPAVGHLPDGDEATDAQGAHQVRRPPAPDEPPRPLGAASANPYYCGNTVVLLSPVPVRKLSISLSWEVDQALDLVAASTGRSKSAVIEMLLRENALLQKELEIVRLEEPENLGVVPSREFREWLNARRAAEAAGSSGGAGPTPALRKARRPARSRTSRTSRAIVGR
jgi:predicted transcriptional regulator